MIMTHKSAIGNSTVGHARLLARIMESLPEWERIEQERLGERLLTPGQRRARTLMRKAATVLGYERARTADDTSIRLWLEREGLTYVADADVLCGQYDEGTLCIQDHTGRWVHGVTMTYLCGHCLRYDVADPVRNEEDLAGLLMKHVRCGIKPA